jgi:tetratricopeptide (TPR) repeat protein
LISSHVYQAVEQHFSFEPRPPLLMKGKAEPLPVFAVTGERKQRAIRLQEPTYALPIVGRETELQIINDKLDLALQGKSQIIGVVAEAGMGKSRLVAEVIRSARRKGFAGYGGACQSDGINTPYLAWKPIWGAFFDVDPSAPLRKQIRALEGEIEDRAPERVQALPLLSSVLDLDIPENDFTSNLEPQYRKSALTALFEDCLRAASKDEPLLIVVEDLHWIDALSHDLLEDLAKALADCPICFVLAYRPPQLTRLQAPRLEALPQFTKIELHELNRAEAESAIRAKLTQLYPARSGAVPAPLVDKLMTRAQGNPFYLEELLNYLRDRGLDPRDPSDLNKIELPDSLHALVLSRIDQLSEREKTTLRVASIVGRLFRAAWLTGYYPALGEVAHVKVDLDQLEALDITPLDSEPELAYLFKHIVTHEVTYESLPFATRARLHEQLARYLEDIDAPIDAIAYHYGQSNNLAKQREYWQKAGEAAQAAFANDAALEYFANLLPLLTDPREKIALHLQRGELFFFIGQIEQAGQEYKSGLALAEALPDSAAGARAQRLIGTLFSARGDYEKALDWLGKALLGYETLGDAQGQAQTLLTSAWINFIQGDPVTSRERFEKALTLARSVADKASEADALSQLGTLASYSQEDYPAARALQEESLQLRRELGDKQGIANSLTKLAIVASAEDDWTMARVFYNEALALNREIGFRAGVARSLFDIGRLDLSQGDYTTARAVSNESLALYREIGDKRGSGMVLTFLGDMAVQEGNYAVAQTLLNESLTLNREMGEKWGMATALWSLADLSIMQDDYLAARSFSEESLSISRELDSKENIAGIRNLQGMIALEQGEYATARAAYLESLTSSMEFPTKYIVLRNLAGLAGLAAAEGMPERAARFAAAAAETVRVSIGVTFAAPDRRLFERTVASAKESLGEAGFQSAWEAGAAMTLEEAVKFALEKGEG